MKRMFCLLCLSIISVLSVFMVSASEPQVCESELKNELYGNALYKNALYIFPSDPTERIDVPPTKIVNAETEEVYASEEAFYEIYGKPAFSTTDLVHQIIYMIPDGPNSTQLLREVHEKIRNQITEEGLDPFTLKK